MKIQRLVFPDKHRCEVEDAELNEALAPGATIFVTNQEAAPHTRSAEDFVVLATHHDEAAG